MGRRSASLPLFPEEARSASPGIKRTTPPEPRPAVSTHATLWLCVHLECLSLEALELPAALTRDNPPLAVIDGEGAQRFVLTTNRRARDAGIAPGLKLNAAYALAPQLETLKRDLHSERKMLERLAVWAGGFTSFVSLEPPAALLLEVGGSLRLFGDLETLGNKIKEGLKAQGCTARIGVAPTPLGALWLARAGVQHPVTDLRRLIGALAPLSLSVTHWPEDTLNTLARMGVSTVGQCLRLPRDGFARRLGKTRLNMLDRAVGRLPDPRLPHDAPERFSLRLELPAEMQDVALIMEGVKRLLKNLAEFLLYRQGGVQTLQLRLYHMDLAATKVRLGLSGPSRDAGHIAGLFAERLERFPLPAPVLALTLKSGPVAPLELPSGSLFGRTLETSQYEIPALVERLRARLGMAAVHGVCLVSEHRPEAAWRPVEPSEGAREEGAGYADTPFQRPLWLLAEPEPLRAMNNQPNFEGGLTFLSGPERIETGWWDGSDMRRDYYIARNPEGVRLWLFRECRPPRHWFLHGVFG